MGSVTSRQVLLGLIRKEPERLEKGSVAKKAFCPPRALELVPGKEKEKERKGKERKKRKKAEQAIRRKKEALVSCGLCFSCCLQICTLTFCPNFPS